MSDEELLRLFRRGLIPGPKESEEAFLTRVANSPQLLHSEWQEVSVKTLPVFGCAIDWMPITYSNRRLAWWEGAATWISDTPFIQLKNRFQKGKYLGYDRTEILVHEAIHAARIKFNEPQFEEMLAYSLSKKSWKRFLGPLFSYSWQPFLLLLAIFAGYFWISIPLLVLGFSMVGLGWKHYLFRRQGQRLPFSVILCLTDKEIRTGRINNDSTLRSRLVCMLLEKSSNTGIIV
jgi:hypothetical protein